MPSVRTTVRVSTVLIGVALVSLGVTGCGDDQPRTASTPSAAPSPSATATAVAANLLQLCDHAQDAFRSGGLGDAEQRRALSAELQGMIDVADPEAAQVLRPMAEAAAAIAMDGQERARPILRQAENRAYRELQRVCRGAGSQSWAE
jgi:hypothetical protein